MNAPVFRIVQIDIAERPVSLALPFHFGNVTVTHTAEAYLRVVLEHAGGRTAGVAAQLMVPRWFDKRLERSADQTVDDLRETLRAAQAAAPGLSGSVRSLSETLRAAVVEALPDLPRLAAGFGPALCEMAMIDAACRAHDIGFADAVRADLFGVGADLPADLPSAAYDAWRAALAPHKHLRLRHTVGFDAALTTAEVGARPADGRPVAISEIIAQTGISAFKIKVTGDVAADLERLRGVAGEIGKLADPLVTIDANEQYDPERLAALWDGVSADERLAGLRGALAFFEQPFAREIALAEGAHFDFPVPTIIDESDDSEDALLRAFEAGYSGTSVKSCKGVLRALVNAARVAARRAEGFPAVLSAEDLTCQPGLCWQQDSLMAATVGAAHIERNGHHFAGGMQGASAEEHAAYVAAHPDLYSSGPSGPRLIIENGKVSLGSLFGPGYASDPGPSGLFLPFEQQ